VLLNYVRVTGLVHSGSEVRGVVARDLESGAEHRLDARVVINATGPWADELRRMDVDTAPAIMRPSQGVHLVLPRSFLPGESAIMVPRTDDGRVLFAIPWQDRVLVGTTDTPVAEPRLEPVPFDDEIDYLLEHAGRYLEADPERGDVLSVFAGIRPLVGEEGEDDTASLSRDHSLLIADSGLVTIAGGKWTTYRKMAEDTVDRAATLAGLEDRPCPTRDLQIHGHHPQASRFGELAPYGSDAPDILELYRERPELHQTLHDALPTRAGEVVWAVRQEMARTVEDVLARRSRALLLDARAAIEVAPNVAALMAGELGRDGAWRQAQVDAFRELAAAYIP
jgi:glycerol-3-phosphate dehydrogenase